MFRPGSSKRPAVGGGTHTELLPARWGGWSFVLWWVLASLVGGAAGLFVGTLAVLVAQELSVGYSRTGPVGYAVFRDINGAAGDAMFGALLGTVVGAVQWLVLRRRLEKPGWWVPATIVSLAVGSAVGGTIMDRVSNAAAMDARAGVVDYGMAAVLSVAASIVAGIVVGTVMGAAQWLVLQRRVEKAGRWVLVSVVGWAVGWPTIWHAPWGREVFGAVYALFTGPVLLWLLRHPKKRRRFGDRGKEIVEVSRQGAE